MNYNARTFSAITLYCILLTIAYAYPRPLLQTNTSSQPEAITNSTVHRRDAPITGRIQLPNGPPQRVQNQRLSPPVRRRPSEYQAYEDLLQRKPKIKSSDLLVGMNKKPQGAPQKFCSKFGCDCVPAANAKCCSGYRFDKRSNSCRKLSG